MSWDDARAYADWLNAQVGRSVYRLPGESEWEYACRAGTTTARYWGDDWDAGRANAGGAHGATTSAGRFGANPWGLRDMIGNVLEWTADPWIKTLAGYPTDGSPRPGEAEVRATRGGSWSTLPRTARAGYRDQVPALYRRNNIGFRVLRAL